MVLQYKYVNHVQAFLVKGEIVQGFVLCFCIVHNYSSLKSLKLDINPSRRRNESETDCIQNFVAGPRINLAKLQAARAQHQQSHGLYVLSTSNSQSSPFLPLKSNRLDIEEVENC